MAKREAIALISVDKKRGDGHNNNIKSNNNHDNTTQHNNRDDNDAATDLAGSEVQVVLWPVTPVAVLLLLLLAQRQQQHRHRHTDGSITEKTFICSHI